MFISFRALDSIQDQFLGQNNEKLVQIIQTQMVTFLAKIILFLLPLQQTHQWLVLGYPRVQKMRNNHSQDL